LEVFRTSAVDNRVLNLKEKLDEHLPEIVRLQNVWSGELMRIGDTLSREDAWKRIKAMPEAIEQEKLTAIDRPLYQEGDVLVEEIWKIRAQTLEGKRKRSKYSTHGFCPKSGTKPRMKLTTRSGKPALLFANSSASLRTG
jgi:hypothetical protein